MRLVTYRLGQDGARVGVERDGLIIDVEHFGEVYGLPLPSTMLELIDMGPLALQQLDEALVDADQADLVGTSVPASNAKLLAPIPRPRKNVFGIGLNYTEHVAELGFVYKKGDQGRNRGHEARSCSPKSARDVTGHVFAGIPTHSLVRQNVECPDHTRNRA